MPSGKSAGFRQAREEDLDEILEIVCRYYAEDGYAFDEADAKAAVLGLMRNANYGRIWVAIDQGSVVGYMAVTLGFSLEYRGRDAFIDELYILEPGRGKGLGQEAIAIAEAYCLENGVKALHLEVERHREAARNLYRKFGFDDHERLLMTMWLDDGSKRRAACSGVRDP